MALIYADLYAPPTNWFRPDPFSPAAARSPCRLQKFLLSRDRTFLRKFNEILLALQIERELSKPEIMELYLNKIYLGNRAYGIEAAAQVYYGQSAQDLSLAQMAMIAGLPKAPSAWNPLADPERALIRRNWILSRMQALGYIDQETYQQAKARDISARYHGPEVEASAPYIAEMVRQDALRRFGERRIPQATKSTLRFTANVRRLPGKRSGTDLRPTTGAMAIGALLTSGPLTRSTTEMS